jgi:hypothetical protein
VLYGKMRGDVEGCCPDGHASVDPDDAGPPPDPEEFLNNVDPMQAPAPPPPFPAPGLEGLAAPAPPIPGPPELGLVAPAPPQGMPTGRLEELFRGRLRPPTGGF